MVASLRKAGQQFGFPNLAGLFEDEEEGKQLEGIGLAPRFEVSRLQKGRGGVLSFKAPKLPTQTSTFALEPTRLAGEGLNINLSQQQEQTQAPIPEPEPTPEQPKTYTYTDPGDKGYFGMKDYNELMSQGAPESVIKEYAEKAQYGLGPIAAQVLGMKPYTETQGVTTEFPYTAATTIKYTDPGDKGYFGMQDYNELMSQGANENLIRQYASKAPMGLGPEAARILGMQATTQTPTTPAPQKTYTYTDPGDKGYFGRKDYEELAGQGASMDVIREYARKSPLGVGEWAKGVLGL